LSFGPEFVTPEGIRLPSFDNRQSKVENILLAVRDKEGQSGAKSEPPARINDLKHLSKTLRRFRRLTNRISDFERLRLLNPLIRLFSEQGLDSLVLETLQYALCLEMKGSALHLRLGHRLDLGETAARAGHRNIARTLYLETASLIRKVDLAHRPFLYARVAALQKAIGDAQFQTNIDRALDSTQNLTPSSQARMLRHLSQILVQAGEPEVARVLLNDIPESGSVPAKADLAAHWASRWEENYLYLSFALSTFREARADLTTYSHFPTRTGHKLHLAKAMRRAGTLFEEELKEVLSELEGDIVRIGDFKTRQSLHHELALRFAEDGQFEKALNLADHKVRAGEERSQTYADVAREMAFQKRYLEAVHLLKSRSMLPEHRFFALLNVLYELKGMGVPWKSTAKQILQQARRQISRFSFQSPGTTIQAWLDLAMSNFDQGRPVQAWHYLEKGAQLLYSGDLDRNSMVTGICQLVLDQFELINLGRADFKPSRLRQALKIAQAKGNTRAVAQIALAMGFLEIKFPEEGHWNPQTWAWYLWGNSLRPNVEDSDNTFFIDQGVTLLGRLEKDPTSSQAKAHLLLLNAFENYSPLLAQNTAWESTELALTHELGFQVDLREIHRPLLQFNPGNRILYQNLSWLARRGDPESRALVQDLIDLPQFPAAWRKPLDRALAKRRSAIVFSSPVKVQDELN
jgi:hypothetical protein